MFTPLPGGWSTYSCKISADEQKVFDEAMDGLLGVNYKPIAVATQIVAGTNYAFFCNAQVVAPNTPVFGAVIYIKAPLPAKGGPKIVDIVEIPDFDYEKAKKLW